MFVRYGNTNDDRERVNGREEGRRCRYEREMERKDEMSYPFIFDGYLRYLEYI
jgi:hypothetical protein